jgi:repressor of nif and glnA expression
MITPEGQHALELCVEKAESTTDWDTERAVIMALEVLKEHGRLDAENVVLEVKARGMVPHDDRAFGAMFKMLIHRQLCQRVGQTTRRRGRGTAGNWLYELQRQS